jgi:hypothetical protein
LLGAVFGIHQFSCKAVFRGLSVFGATLLQINTFYTFILAMVPLCLMGWLVRPDLQGPLHVGTGQNSSRLLSRPMRRLDQHGSDLAADCFLRFGNTDICAGFRPTVPTIIALLVSVIAAWKPSSAHCRLRRHQSPVPMVRKNGCALGKIHFSFS